MSEKSVTVRAAVAVDPETGFWVVFGEQCLSDIEMAEDAGWEDGPTQITHITAEIPIREPAEVQAQLATPDEKPEQDSG